MADVTLPITDPTGDGDDTNYWSDVYSNLTAITDQVNGNIDSDNLAALAVSAAKIQAGAVTDAKMGLTTHVDTQTGGGVTASGALTGVSLTPGAGTYLAIGVAEGTNTSTSDYQDWDLSIQVNGSNQATSPGIILHSGSPAQSAQATVVNVITVASAGHAVTLYGNIHNNTTITAGRLVLVRIA